MRAFANTAALPLNPDIENPMSASTRDLARLMSSQRVGLDPFNFAAVACPRAGRCSSSRHSRWFSFL